MILEKSNWKHGKINLKSILDNTGNSRHIISTPMGRNPMIRVSRELGLRKVSVQFGRSVVSNSLRPHGLQHARLPCPSPASGACSNSCPLSRWCHPTISSSVVPFSSRLQSFPASGSFPVNQFFPSVARVLEFQLQPQSFQWIFRTDFL